MNDSCIYYTGDIKFAPKPAGDCDNCQTPQPALLSHSPQHRRVDLGAVDVDDGEGGVDGELAEHGQSDGDPGEIKTRGGLGRDERTRDADEATEDVEEAERQTSADAGGEHERVMLKRGSHYYVLMTTT